MRRKPVRVGQEWALLNCSNGFRIQVRVERFEELEGNPRQAICTNVKTGKPYKVPVRTLATGGRCAKLLSDPGGELPKPPAPKPPAPEKSIVRRTYHPRGMIKRRELTPNEAKAVELRGKGLTLRGIGDQLGVTAETVRRMLNNADDIALLKECVS
jgi:DNA-binding CsgD family transcriptional regulator